MKNKGFTLVELLAVITVLAIILVIAIPQIMNVINDAKKETFATSAKTIASKAEEEYLKRIVFKQPTNNITCSDVSKINNNNYGECTIEFIDDKAHVKLIGMGKFEGMNACDATKMNAEVTDECIDLSVASNYISNLYNTAAGSNGLIKDDTTDQNIRYTGSTPNNYVYFNCSDYSNQTSATCEVWRIIGTFNVSNGTTIENRVKIIREDRLNNTGYAWDNKDTSTGAESNYGKNDWTTSRLMELLNPKSDGTSYYDSGTTAGSLYWNSGSGKCYSGLNNALVNCNFTSSGIKNEATKNLIGTTLWNIGGFSTIGSISAKNAYIVERGTTVHTGRTTTWTGKVGLMYPSDYGYASTDTGCTTLSQSVCKNNNWIYKSYDQWALSSHSSNTSGAFHVYSRGDVYYSGACNALSVRPVVYLKSSAKIMSGDGSSTSPYKLG